MPEIGLKVRFPSMPHDYATPLTSPPRHHQQVSWPVFWKISVLRGVRLRWCAAFWQAPTPSSLCRRAPFLPRLRRRLPSLLAPRQQPIRALEWPPRAAAMQMKSSLLSTPAVHHAPPVIDARCDITSREGHLHAAGPRAISVICSEHAENTTTHHQPHFLAIKGAGEKRQKSFARGQRRDAKDTGWCLLGRGGRILMVMRHESSKSAAAI